MNIIYILFVSAARKQQKALSKVVKEKSLPSIISTVSTVSEAKALLQIESFDIVVSEYRIKDSTVIELLPHLKVTPSIVLMEPGNCELLIKVVNAGAWDFIIKDSQNKYLDLLPVTISKVLENKKLVEKITESLFLSEHRYGELVQALPDIVYELDAEGYFIFINNSVRLLGYEPQELIVKHFKEIVHQDDLPLVSRKLVLRKYKGKITGDKDSPKLFDERRSGERKTSNLELRLIKKGWKKGRQHQDEMIGSVISYAEVSATGQYKKGEDRKKTQFVGTVGIIRDITTRRKAEKLLRELYRAVDQSYVLIIITDAGGSIEYVNPWLFKFTGYNPEEIMGKNIRILLSGKQPADFYNKIFSELVSGGNWQGEMIDKKKNGEHFWVSATISPVFDPGGNITHFISVQEDITGRKKIEESLVKSEQKFRSIIENAGDGIMLADEEGTIIEWNCSQENITGLKKEEMIGKNISDTPLIPGPVGKRKLLLLQKQKGKPGKLPWLDRMHEGVIIHPDGSRRVHQSRIFSFKTGKEFMFGAISRGITERKRAEDILRESEEKYRSLVENIPDVTWTCNNKSRIIFISPNVEKILGFTPEEIYNSRGRLWFDRIHPDNIELVKEAYGLLFKKNRIFDVEYQIQRKDEQWIWQHDRAVATYEKDGEMYADGISSDITKRKQAEQKLLFYQKRLRYLTSQYFFAEERERQKIAHELHDYLGQTLSASKMKLEILNSSISQADLVDLIDEIKKLIDQSVRYTRALTFDLSPHFLHVLGLEGMLRRLTEQFQHEYNVQIRYADDGRRKPLANEMQILLYRAVRELLMNAIKHARADKIKLSLQRDDSAIKITVQDDGISFDASIIDHPSDMKGFGLFSICERLNYVGGRVEIESKPGQGSRITLWAELQGEGVEDDAE